MALGARWFLPNERLSSSQWLGLGLCFAGVAAAIGIPQANVDSRVLWGDFLVIGSAVGWAATTLVMKGSRLVKSAARKDTGLPTQHFGSDFCGDQRFVRGAHDPVAGRNRHCMDGFQVLVVGLTFPVWFTLIQRYSATRVSAFTVLTPLFGVAAGYLLLNEPFTIGFAVAVILVIAGLAPGQPALAKAK